MTEKELKKVGRSELLEILISQMKENEKLQAQLEAAETELKEANKKLADKQICILNAGSIAEAALVLNNVFEAAEAAGAQYVENVRLLNERQQAACERTERESREEAAQLIGDTEKQCRERTESTEEYCRKLTADTEEQCRKLTADTEEQCRKLAEDTEEQCSKQMEETEQKCLELERITAEKCTNMEQDAQTKIQAYWDDITDRLKAFYEEHAGLRELLSGTVPK